MAGADVAVRRGRDRVPSAAEIESLYFAAFGGEPLYESREVAAHFAQLYDSLTSRPDLVTVLVRRDGELAGLAYGHPWQWAEQVDDWAHQLRERLGGAADNLEGRLAVYLLAVHPDYRRQGLGRLLLRELLEAGDTQGAWLITRDEPTPAMALYEAEGWRPVGHGPDTPDERPGMVLIQG